MRSIVKARAISVIPLLVALTLCFDLGTAAGDPYEQETKSISNNLLVSSSRESPIEDHGLRTVSIVSLNFDTLDKAACTRFFNVSNGAVTDFTAHVHFPGSFANDEADPVLYIDGLLDHGSATECLSADSDHEKEFEARLIKMGPPKTAESIFGDKPSGPWKLMADEAERDGGVFEIDDQERLLATGVIHKDGLNFCTSDYDYDTAQAHRTVKRVAHAPGGALVAITTRPIGDDREVQMIIVGSDGMYCSAKGEVEYPWNAVDLLKNPKGTREFEKYFLPFEGSSCDKEMTYAAAWMELEQQAGSDPRPADPPQLELSYSDLRGILTFYTAGGLYLCEENGNRYVDLEGHRMVYGKENSAPNADNDRVQMLIKKVGGMKEWKSGAVAVYFLFEEGEDYVCDVNSLHWWDYRTEDSHSSSPKKLPTDVLVAAIQTPGTKTLKLVMIHSEEKNVICVMQEVSEKDFASKVPSLPGSHGSGSSSEGHGHIPSHHDKNFSGHSPIPGGHSANDEGKTHASQPSSSEESSSGQTATPNSASSEQTSGSGQPGSTQSTLSPISNTVAPSTSTSEALSSTTNASSTSTTTLNLTTSTSTTTSSTPAVSGTTGGACFPGHATVELRDGSVIPIRDLEIRDEVKVGPGVFSPVFMFTHRLSDSVHDFITFETARGASLSMSQGHYIYLDGSLAPAHYLKVGSKVSLEDGSDDVVVRVFPTTARGLYNPQTVSGDIIVNGVVASTYTSFVEPAIAHAMLAPMRALFQHGGLWTAIFEEGAPTWTNFLSTSSPREVL